MHRDVRVRGEELPKLQLHFDGARCTLQTAQDNSLLIVPRPPRCRSKSASIKISDSGRENTVTNPLLLSAKQRGR